MGDKAKWGDKLGQMRRLDQVDLSPQEVEPLAPRLRQDGTAAGEVSWPLRVAAEWSWRLLLVIAVLYAVIYAAIQIKMVVIPVAVAVLLAVLLEPFTRFLRKRLRFPSALAAFATVTAALLVVGGLLSIAGTQIAAGMGALAKSAYAGLDKLLDWLIQGPLHLNANQIQYYFNNFTAELTTLAKNNSSSLASGVMSFTSSIGILLAGLLMVLFCLFFFLYDGRRFWLWGVNLLPRNIRYPIHEAAIRGWVTLGSYARTQTLVAAVDAVGITLGALIIGIPLVIPLGVLVFIGSFVPIVGALVSGSIAVLVAFLDKGPIWALVMFGIVILVQQIEGHVLQPFLMGQAVSIHPVAVLLAVAGGTYLGGIVGALFAVPLVAFLNTTAQYLNGKDRFPHLATDENRPGGPPGLVPKNKPFDPKSFDTDQALA